MDDLHTIQLLLNLPQKPIFIGGCARSGTTLLYSLLSCHPHIHVIRQGTRGIESMVMCADNDELSERIARFYFRHLRNLPDTLTRWCEKTPRNVHYIDRILKTFGQNVHFINIVRDGRDVVSARQPNNPDAYWVSPERWINDVSAGLRHERHDQVTTVKYEDLVSDYVSVLKSLCESINEKFHPDLLDYPLAAKIRTARGPYFEAALPHQRSVSRWRKPEHDAVVSSLLSHKKAEELLRHYSYIE